MGECKLKALESGREKMMERDKKQEQKRQQQLGTVSGLLFYRNFCGMGRYIHMCIVPHKWPLNKESMNTKQQTNQPTIIIATAADTRVKPKEPRITILLNIIA